MKLKILDLFSGIGGFSLGLERTGQFKTVAFCEIDQYCKLLLQKHWKGVKIYNDVKEITQEGFKADGIESPDIITGGFPCQPFSVAGKQKGTSDNRHLWPEMFRIIKAFKPRFIIGENVRGIINIQDGVVFEAVCTDLESEGYKVQPFIIPAAGVGAPHRRERVWIIAIREESMVNSDNIRFEQHIETEEEASRRRSSTTFEPTSDVPNTNESNSRERKVSGNLNDEGGRASETRGESLQSEDRQTRTDNPGSSSEDVADTELQRLQGRQRNDKREGRQILSSEQHDRREIRSEIGCSSGVSRQEDVENSRRTLRQGTELRKENEDEIERKDAHQHQRSSRSSESNVANSESFSSDVGGREEYQEERNRQRKIRGEGSEDVADSSSGRRASQEREIQTGRNSSQHQGWWDVEPDVGRVAHGVSGRVHRLKGLGNSIVPQIAEEIGKAIINMERRKNEERH